MGRSTQPEGPQHYSAVKPPGSRADYVHSVLRREILTGVLLPGAPILQDEIGSRLGVSITPVREALRRLESAGLVSYQTHYGATVSQLSAEAAAELYQVRAAVEGVAARLAAGRITPEELAELRGMHESMEVAHRESDTVRLANGSRLFHARIARIGGPAFLAGHLRWIWENYPVPHTESVWQFDDVADNTLRYHAQILVALERGDAPAAQRLMAEHIESAIGERERHRVCSPATTTPV
ncbi:FCD domain-containing protein [Amycolatopsis sp. RM579]|uniref:FCD domain-containing protein n=1 Tax=Amycolatopsis pithecellobii TaxID=664692 RepID=A0A6N7YLE1_9PSEU|nr:FCD domain-containing protein [Amycolatopsis pithecellobii]